MCGNLDPGSLVKAEELCDQLGLDTISMGVTIAFAWSASRSSVTEREWHAAPLGRPTGPFIA